MEVLFLGLGRMGAPMAARLTTCAAASRVLVCNRTTAATMQHAERHRTHPVLFEDLPQAIGKADVMFTCLPDSFVVREVMDRVKDALRAGAIVVDCTSGDPQLSRQMAEDLATRGIGFLDAPVSGGVTGAEAGTLTTMVGGPSKQLAKVSELLSSFAKNVVHAGEAPGSGHALKAINNIMNATHLLVAAEGLACLKKFGIQPSVALAAINGSSGRSMATTHRMPEHVVTRKFGHGFHCSLMNKDVAIGRSLVESMLPADAAILRTAATEFDTAEKAVGATVDYTEAVKYIETLAGVTITDDNSL